MVAIIILLPDPGIKNSVFCLFILTQRLEAWEVWPSPCISLLCPRVWWLLEGQCLAEGSETPLPVLGADPLFISALKNSSVCFFPSRYSELCSFQCLFSNLIPCMYASDDTNEHGKKLEILELKQSFYPKVPNFQLVAFATLQSSLSSDSFHPVLPESV